MSATPHRPANPPQPADNDLDSLPSTSTSDSDDAADQELTDAEREWQESLQQLELLLTMVLIPFIGKYYGRKFAYWGWAKVMQWKYPVDIVVTDPGVFKAAGAAQAAASL